jgi:hypothetical protein
MTLNQLLAIRSRGQRPDSPVIVSLAGRLRVPYPVVVIDDTISVDSLDLRPMADLDAIVAHTGTMARRTVNLACALARAGAYNIDIWDVPQDRWVAVLFCGKSFITEVPPSCVM